MVPSNEQYEYGAETVEYNLARAPLCFRKSRCQCVHQSFHFICRSVYEGKPLLFIVITVKLFRRIFQLDFLGILSSPFSMASANRRVDCARF